MSNPTDLFSDILARFEGAGGTAADTEVTRKTLSLGAADATTGCYAMSYSAGDTIHMPIFSKATARSLMGTGFHVKENYLGFASTSVDAALTLAKSDTITDKANLVYVVLAVKPHRWGDINVLYEAELALNPFAAL